MTTIISPKPPSSEGSQINLRSNHPSSGVAQMVYGELSGIRINFINMPLRESASPNTPPQGPGLMAARLRQYGAEPTIIDLNAYRIKDEDAARRGLPNGRHLTLQEAE